MATRPTCWPTILSWISPGGYNPATAIIHTLTDRILKPFQRIIPPLGGLDLSPIFAIVLLQAGVEILAQSSHHA